MAEAQLQQFLDKVRQLNAFVALSEADPAFRQRLRDCASHQEVVDLARECGFDIARRWGEPPSVSPAPAAAGPRQAQDGGAPSGSRADPGQAKHLLSGPCPPAGQEVTDTLLELGQARLVLIHSCQFANPPGFWYDQREAEWVLVLQGSARLRFADEAQARALRAGDSLWISPGRRHRVEATDPAPGTRWLALFWSEGG